MADTKIPVPHIPVNREKKEACLKTIRAEIDALDLKRQISMPKLLLDQIHYISLEYWIIQSFFLIAAVVLLTCFGSLIKGSENILPPVCALSSGLVWRLCWNWQKAVPVVWRNWNRAAALTWDRSGQ